MTTLQQRLRELIDAGFAGLWLQSYEHPEARQEIRALCQAEGWHYGYWNLAAGLELNGDARGGTAEDPLAPFPAMDDITDGRAVLILENYHRFCDSALISQVLANRIHAGKTAQRHYIVVSHATAIPAELQRAFTIVEHSLPDRAALARIAREIATEDDEWPTDEGEQAAILDSAAGLTASEAENAFALSIIRQGKIAPQAVWELKSSAMKKSGLLSLHKGAESFDSLGGLQSVKAFTRRALRNGKPMGMSAKGILLLGVSGTGKSSIAKALGNEVGRPTISLNTGALMGSLVGETESNTRQALSIIDAMAPCILFVDEVEKALAGTGGSGATDSGVGRRMLGSLLTWLADHTSDVFVIATANDISALPPELTAAHRFDATFFLDLPSRVQKDAIWDIYQTRYQITDDTLPEDRDWTGSEIHSCCRLATLLDLPLTEAAKNVIPVAHSKADQVEALRQWASGRCLDSERPGVYSRNPAAATPEGRRSVERRQGPTTRASDN